MCCNNCNRWNNGRSGCGCGCGWNGNFRNTNRCCDQFQQISTNELLAIREDFLNAPTRITRANNPFATSGCGCCCNCCG